MADNAMNVDAYTPAVVTSASKWLEAIPGTNDLVQQVDGYVPAVVNATSKWQNVEGRGCEWPYENLFTIVAAPWSVRVYKMRGMDALTDGVYDTWLAQNEPDLDASEYAGALNTPLRDVIVIDTWSA